MNLPFPKWCPQDCYEKLQKLSALYYKIYSLSDELTKYVAGPTLDVFLRNIHNETSEKKIYLYSAHDINIATITRGLHLTGSQGVPIPEIPDFGSSIVVEKLRDSKDNVYVRVCNSCKTTLF